MLKRTSLLSVLLAAAIVFAVSSAYRLWEDGPWDLPKPGKARAPVASEEPDGEESRPPQLANTRTIIDRNLFDPERGQNRTKNDEVSSAAMQRIRSLVLLGTAILGDSRHAIVEDPTKAAGPAKAQSGSSGQMRFRQGDSWEGFKLSEVRERSVVFTQGASRVELALDYSRSGAPPAPRASGVPAVAPRVVAPVQPEPRVAPERQAPLRDAVKTEPPRLKQRGPRGLSGTNPPGWKKSGAPRGSSANFNRRSRRPGRLSGLPRRRSLLQPKARSESFNLCGSNSPQLGA